MMKHRVALFLWALMLAVAPVGAQRLYEISRQSMNGTRVEGASVAVSAAGPSVALSSAGSAGSVMFYSGSAQFGPSQGSLGVAPRAQIYAPGASSPAGPRVGVRRVNEKDDDDDDDFGGLDNNPGTNPGDGGEQSKISPIGEGWLLLALLALAYGALRKRKGEEI